MNEFYVPDECVILYALPVSEAMYELEVQDGVVVNSHPTARWPIGQRAAGLWKRAAQRGVDLVWYPA